MDTQIPLTHWGNLWQSEWWVADLSHLNKADNYFFDITRVTYPHPPFAQVGTFITTKNQLWEKTWRLCSYEQGERRARLAMNRIGWQDCGAAWQEANSHVAFALGLLDLLEFKTDAMTPEERARIEQQVRNGLDYLSRLQERAVEMGTPGGAIVHQTPTLEEILPSDTIKAAVCWARASRLLSGEHADAKHNYFNCAGRAYRWFDSTARPNHANFSHLNHGAPTDYVPPANEWRTSDLCMQLWAAFSLWETMRDDLYKAECARVAALVLSRQVLENNATLEGGFFGHFRTFDDAPFTEKAWTHHIDNKIMGGDAGGHFPHWILPLIQMCRAWPNHGDAQSWRDAVSRFAYGYFDKACRANPFLILPLGYFQNEGLLWFAGGWHGTTAIYGLAAALALEFADFLNDAKFREIATGNLQWIAGLNCGITKDSQFASHIFSMDVPENVALPVSLIHGVGDRFAGGWLNVRGSICNGFSAGQQFRFDVEATKQNDAPTAFTDEDWISHAGAWLSGIARL